MTGLVKLTAPELLEGALAFVSIPGLEDVEPEPLERFALVLELLAEQLQAEAPGCRALAALRLAIAQLWAEGAPMTVTVLSADRPAEQAELRGNVLRVRAELREGGEHE